jgi:recombination protein RecA
MEMHLALDRAAPVHMRAADNEEAAHWRGLLSRAVAAVLAGQGDMVVGIPVGRGPVPLYSHAGFVNGGGRESSEKLEQISRLAVSPTFCGILSEQKRYGIRKTPLKQRLHQGLRERNKRRTKIGSGRVCLSGADNLKVEQMAQNSLRLVEENSVDKSKALDAALSQIERAFGKGSIMKLGSNEQVVEIETVPTGSLGLDIALGVGGLPKGRIIEVYGPESSGKTTLALHVIAEAQKKGGIAGFIDAEHALDPVYARKLGVDLENLLISQPDNGEQALEITDTLVRSGAIDVLVVDSVAALTPRAEIEGEMGDSLPGLQARLMSQALRKLTGSISRSNCMVIFINQIRMKIGVMFGSPETTTGGNALKFYSSVRLDIRRIGSVKDRDETVGNQTRVKVVKNKMAPPLKQIEFDIMYGEGISKTGELIDLGVKAGIVEKSGSWFSYNSQRLGQGRENARMFLKENPETAREIELAIRQNAGLIADNFFDEGEGGEVAEG